MDHSFTEADHERALRAGRHVMAQQEPGQPPERREHPGWRFLFGWLAFCQFVALVIAVINVFHQIDLNRAVVGYLISWPVLISPAWLGTVAAFVALVVMIRVWNRLGGNAGS